MSRPATAHPESGAALGEEQRMPRRRSRPLLVWAAVAVVTLAGWAALTWPLALQPDDIWTVRSSPGARGAPVAGNRPGTLLGGDHLQNAFIQSVVVDNLRELRNPYLDLREGAAGPAPLRTTSLDLPWTPVVAVLWPLAGLQAAYNANLLLSTLVTGLAAFGWLRRHTAWPLLAAAGALAYTFTPHRMFQLTSHFNAVMWWAFPAALWAFEVAMERHRAGRPWMRPALAVVAVTVTVAVSGEYHLILYLTGLLCFLVAWTLATAVLARRPAAGRSVPWAPAATVVAGVVVGVAYVLLAFRAVFKGTVAGTNGSWQQVLLYAPASARALVQQTYGMLGEGIIYVGWAVVALAAAGFVAALAGRDRSRSARPYAVVLVPVLLLTLGPAADLGPLRPYRFAFDHLPFLSLQRVPQRLMVVTSLLLVLLAVCTLDLAIGRMAANRPHTLRAAAAVLLAATLLLLNDYVIGRNVVMPDVDDNRVVAALKASGDRAGPIVGVPIVSKTSPWNSVSTYVAALSRRRTLNAYNQTPAPWLHERLRRLQPLNEGRVDAATLRVLRGTGATQLVVIHEPHEHERPGEWRSIVDRLTASGRFRLVASDGPLALLELTARS